MSTSSTKPYLVRAIHEWCVDNGFTPYVVVQVDEHTRVPMQHVREGQIVLNIAPYATNRLMISNEDISCQARFGGVAQELYLPMTQVLAIYSRESGQGVAFQQGALSGSGMELGGVISADDVAESGETSSGAEGGADTPPDAPPPAPRGGHLRRVK